MKINNIDFCYKFIYAENLQHHDYSISLCHIENDLIKKALWKWKNMKKVSLFHSKQNGFMHVAVMYAKQKVIVLNKKQGTIQLAIYILKLNPFFGNKKKAKMEHKLIIARVDMNLKLYPYSHVISVTTVLHRHVNTCGKFLMFRKIDFFLKNLH